MDLTIFSKKKQKRSAILSKQLLVFQKRGFLLFKQFNYRSIILFSKIVILY